MVLPGPHRLCRTELIKAHRGENDVPEAGQGPAMWGARATFADLYEPAGFSPWRAIFL